jgi:hypothetical protein
MSVPEMSFQVPGRPAGGVFTLVLHDPARMQVIKITDILFIFLIFGVILLI